MKTQQSQTNIPRQSIKMSSETTMSSKTKMTSENYSLLNENVPITTRQQLHKNLTHWRQLLNAVAETTRIFCRTKLTLRDMSDKMKFILSLTRNIKEDEHYWILIIIPGIFKVLANIAIFTRHPESRNELCTQMHTRIKKITTILEKTNQGGNRWRRTLFNMKKKLRKMTTSYPLYLCYHQDELTCLRIIVNVAEILIKTMSCMDREKKTSIPQTPQPSSSKRKRKG